MYENAIPDYEFDCGVIYDYYNEDEYFTFETEKNFTTEIGGNSDTEENLTTEIEEICINQIKVIKSLDLEQNFTDIKSVYLFSAIIGNESMVKDLLETNAVSVNVR